MATAKKSNSGAVAAEIGAGLAAAGAAAAAGYYFYASKDAKKNRKLAAKWANDLKKDVVKEAKKLGDLTPATLATVIDGAASAYRSIENIDRKDLKRAADELKANWEMVKKEAKSISRGKAVKKAVATAKKAIASRKPVAKKAAPKKVVKKAAKKR